MSNPENECSSNTLSVESNIQSAMEGTSSQETNPKIEEKSEVQKNAASLEEEIPEDEEFQSVLERYYTPMYCLYMDGKPIDHHCVLFHSNKICLLTIAPSHPVIKFKKTIYRINCSVTGDKGSEVDRMKNKVSGKRKKGGQKLSPNTLLCNIECCDGTSYKVFSCVKGKLIEMNDSLVEDPNLLLGYPDTKGHLAVLLSDLSTVELCKKDMIDEAEYKKRISEKNY